MSARQQHHAKLAWSTLVAACRIRCCFQRCALISTDAGIHHVQWAEQGVLMLNASLTVRAHAANSHKKKASQIIA